jgi:hypothetical protein
MDFFYCKKNYEFKLRNNGSSITIFDKGKVYKVDKISDEYRIYIDDEKFLTIKNVERFHKYFKIISQHRNEIINKIID